MPHRRTVPLICLCLLWGLGVGCRPASTPTNPYAGRYALTPDLVFDVRVQDSLLTLLPSFWRTDLILLQDGEDSFHSLLHPDFRFQFVRDSTHRISAIEASGNRQIEGRAQRLAEAERLPVELLLSGDGRGALALLEKDVELADPQRAVRLGFNLIANLPSRAEAGADFLSGLEARFPDSADLFEAIGHGWMLAGERGKATEAFRRVVANEPDNRTAQRALRHLDPEVATTAPENAWTLPFSLDSLFAPPTPSEIAATRREWSERRLEATDVQQVALRRLTFEGADFTARILSHSVHGDRHYGAVLIPEGADADCCPVVLELRGVSADYSPFNVERARVPKILGENLSGVILAIPSFRGNTLVVGDTSFASGGSPRDAWDGAADDAISFFNVVREVVPEADTTRACAYGKSRGGTVALLMGARDKRIDCVVNWAGPAEWFGNMGTFGWTLREQVEWALWERWAPGGGWGSSDQFVDWFLAEPIAHGALGLEETRRSILASSPLYFLDALPNAQMHYGVEDRSVPISNAQAIQRALGESATVGRVHQHQGAGHDMPYPRAHQASRAFILPHLFD